MLLKSAKFLLIISIMGIAGCKPVTPTTPTETIELPTSTNSPLTNPIPDVTIEPTAQSPTEIVTEVPTNSSLPITIQNVNQLTLSNTLTMQEPVRIKWNLDQNSFTLIGFEGFWIYSYPELQLLFEYQFQPDEMLVDVSSDGETYVLSFNQSSLIVKNWQTNQSHTIQTNINFMGGDISPDGTEIILVQQDIWAGPVFDLESGNIITTITGFETAAPVYNISFGEDGNHAIWNARATIRLSDISSNTIGEPIFHEDFLASFSLSPNGEILATSALGTNNDAIIPLVFFYDAASTEELATVEIESAAFSMDFSPNSQLLSVADGNMVALLDSIELIEIFRFEGDSERVNNLEFSPNGDVLAVCGANQTVTFWTIPTP